MKSTQQLKDQQKKITEQLAKAALDKHVDEYSTIFSKYVEELAKLDLMINRERALRVSGGGGAMYLRGKVGSYTSKDEAEQAILIIKQLNQKRAEYVSNGTEGEFPDGDDSAGAVPHAKETG